MPLVVALAACDDVAVDPGPPPDAAHQHAVRERHDRVVGERYPLERASAFRFEPPVPARVASWHWETVPEGRPHRFGHRHGWRVDFVVTPHHAGYPAQPEARRMAFFGDGALRGIFAPSGGGAPLELDAWSPLWVDPHWPAVDPAAPPR